MTQNVQIIFIKDNPEHKKPPFKVIQEITDGNQYIESVSFKTEIVPTVDFPFISLFTEFEEAKVPTIRPKHAKHIKYSLSDNQLFHFIGALKSGVYHQAHKWKNEPTSKTFSHWFIRYSNKEDIPQFIFEFLKENNLTYSFIDEH